MFENDSLLDILYSEVTRRPGIKFVVTCEKLVLNIPLMKILFLCRWNCDGIGTVGLVFSAFGILISGLVITKYKPRARVLAMTNVVVGAISALGIISYAFLGCTHASDTQGTILQTGE